MMRMILGLLLLLASAAASAQSARWPLTPVGYGPVRIGMTQSQVERALGVRLVGEAINDEQSCVERRAVRSHPGLFFMFEDRLLTRIAASTGSRVTTSRGIRVGASESQVRRAYPRGLRSEPHHYVDLPARYLTYWVAPDVRGVRFVTDEHRRVQSILAGGYSIQYVEGCA